MNPDRHELSFRRDVVRPTGSTGWRLLQRGLRSIQ
jgi:hypothetical protein